MSEEECDKPVPTFQQRVIAEAPELKEKIDKLLVFIESSSVYQSLPTDAQLQLCRQHHYMTLYYHILCDRISIFNKGEARE